MPARFILLASMFASAPAATQTLTVGLTVPAVRACGSTGCLRIVEGRYHPATIASAAPDAGDRRRCAAGFSEILLALSSGRPLAGQILHRARRCHSLGLAPLIVRG